MFVLTRLSLANRALIALITVFVMIYGVVATGKLKQELIPSIEFPQVFIVASYPGASPQVVESKVTTPLEQAVLTLQGLESSSSTSSSGQSVVVATMKYGSSMNIVQQDVRAAISRVDSTFPDGVTTQVITGSIDSFPILVLSVSDDTDRVALAERLNRGVVPALSKLEGVRSVEVAGAPEQQVQITLYQTKLAAAGLGTADVVAGLSGAGVLVAAGTVDDKNQTLSVTVGAQFSSADQVGAVSIIPSNPQGKVATISQLGQVKTATGPVRSISRTDGRASVTLSITKVPDANTVAVSQAVKDALPGLTTELGQGATFTEVFDQAPFITESIRDLLVEGGLGLLMAVVVILLFLLSVRSTLVTAVSIPVSVLATLIGLQVAGYSLNILTLGALTIAIGRIVDDSIVVIENIKRHLSYGEPKLSAITTAVREVALAITSATITTVAVFVPIGLVSGQTGELFRPFALTVALALLASLLVSLTIVPVLAYWFLKSPKTTDLAQARQNAIAKEQRSWLQRAYLPTLRWSLRHPVIALLVAALLLAGTVGLATGLKTNFLSDSGQNTLTVSQKFAPALSLKAQDEQAAKLEAKLREIPGVTSVQLTIGSSSLSFAVGSAGESANYNLTLDLKADHVQITERVHQAAMQIGQADDVTVGSSGFGGSSTVDVILTGANPAELSTAAGQVSKAMGGISTVSDVTSTLSVGRPQLQVTAKPLAAQVGLSDQALQRLVSGALSPTTLGRVQPDSGGTLNVVLLPSSSVTTIAQLNALPVPTPAGVKQFSDLAEIKQTILPASIAHTNGQRSVTVSLTPSDPNDLGSLSSTVQTTLNGLALPAGVTAELGGVTEQQNEAFSQLGIALLVAIAIVYVVMVATFKSLVQPLILAISIPFAATGAIAALLISNTPLGVPALIGVLMLIGIVVTNAIVLIDLVNHYRSQGEPLDQALIDGARQRLRPILMTAVATVLALTPMALGLSGGGVFISKPLAIVVIGGLVSSTLLTLVLVPVLYHLVEGPRERRRLRAEGEAEAAKVDDPTSIQDGPAELTTADAAQASDPVDPDAVAPEPAGTADPGLDDPASDGPPATPPRRAADPPR